MAAYWVLNVTYPLKVRDFSLDDTLRAVVGKEPSGSGAGMGARDIDWTFYNADEADIVATKLRAFAIEHNLTVSVDVSMFDNDE